MSENFKMIIGNKKQVWTGEAQRTSGGLRKSNLMVNKRGKVVSIKKHEAGVKRFKENKLRPLSKEELAELRSRRGKGKGKKKKIKIIKEEIEEEVEEEITLDDEKVDARGGLIIPKI